MEEGGKAREKTEEGSGERQNPGGHSDFLDFSDDLLGSIGNGSDRNLMVKGALRKKEGLKGSSAIRRRRGKGQRGGERRRGKGWRQARTARASRLR